MKRIFIYLTIVLLTTQMLGCMTSLAVGSMAGTKTVSKFEYQDGIIGLGTVTLPAGAAKIKDPLVLIGANALYIVAQGQEQVMSLASPILDGKLVNINNGQYISVARNPQNEFSIRLSVTYDKAKNQLSTDEEGYLQAQAFVLRQDGRYAKEVTIKGGIFPPAKNLAEIQKKFKIERKIQVFSTEEVSNIKILDLLFGIPTLIALDVITLPVQIFMAASAPH